MSVYENDALVGETTAHLVSKGHRVFQIFKMGADAHHIGELLKIFDLPDGAYVLDVGCGVGEVSRLMKVARPDLDFALLNISLSQLTMCPDGFPKIHANFERLPLPCSSFDGVMFNYSLGHGDAGKAFAEAARVLKPGGIVLVYDLEGDRELLGYQTRPIADVIAAAEPHGLMVTKAEVSEACPTTDFIDLIGPSQFETLFKGICPVVYRFVKC